MANTYTKIYIHSVFTPMHREHLINPRWEESLYKFITGIVHNNGHKLLAINGVSDHIHILTGFKPDQSVSDMMKDIKANSSRWINANKLVAGKFQWQEGFGAFSYGHSQLDVIIQYVNNQKQHHQRMSFKKEYLSLLKKFEVEYQDEYVFKFFCD
jgi:putative transposase